MSRRRNDEEANDEEAEEIANPRLAFAMRHMRSPSASRPDDWSEIDAALLEETRLPVPAAVVACR